MSWIHFSRLRLRFFDLAVGLVVRLLLSACFRVSLLSSELTDQKVIQLPQSVSGPVPERP